MSLSEDKDNLTTIFYLINKLQLVHCGSKSVDFIKCFFFNFYTILCLHIQRKPLMNLEIFATVHSLMNDINLFDSCQAHLPVQYASNIEFIRQK